jgi:hypothetical protein
VIVAVEEDMEVTGTGAMAVAEEEATGVVTGATIAEEEVAMVAVEAEVYWALWALFILAPH